MMIAGDIVPKHVNITAQNFIRKLRDRGRKPAQGEVMLGGKKKKKKKKKNEKKKKKKKKCSKRNPRKILKRYIFV